MLSFACMMFCQNSSMFRASAKIADKPITAMGVFCNELLMFMNGMLDGNPKNFFLDLQ